MEININKPTKSQPIEIQIAKSSASKNLDFLLVPSDNTDDFDYSVVKPNEQEDFNYSVEEKETQSDFNYSVISSIRKLSQLENDVGYITLKDIPDIDVPRNLSEYNNDVGFITLSEVPKVDLTGLATKEELKQKQDTITDLDTIRSNANKGATAVQPADLARYATQDWVSGQGYITGINSSNVITALGYTPLKAIDLDPYAKTENVQAWLRSKQDKLYAGEGITIEDDVISATGGGGGGDVESILEAINGQSIYPFEVNTYREWENPYRVQNVYLGGDYGLSVDDIVEVPEGVFSKSFNITNGERETEFTISSMNDKYDSYFRFNSNQLYIDLTDRYGNMRNLTISLRFGTVYYSDSERGDFELDLYDVMNALNNLING